MRKTLEQLRALGYVMAAPDAVPAEGESLWRSKVPDYRIDSNGCWIWQKSRTEMGYPSGYAHRKYWVRANGPVPKGTHTHHICKVVACVNPSHLTTLDMKEHIAEHRLVETGRTFADIQMIRADRAVGMTFRAIAAKHGLSYSTVRRWCGNGLEPSWQEVVGERVAVPMGTCKLEECDATFPVLTGPGFKQQYCCPAHRGRHNNKKPEYRAKKAERERRRRERTKAA